MTVWSMVVMHVPPGSGGSECECRSRSARYQAVAIHSSVSELGFTSTITRVSSGPSHRTIVHCSPPFSTVALTKHAGVKSRFRDLTCTGSVKRSRTHSLEGRHNASVLNRNGILLSKHCQSMFPADPSFTVDVIGEVPEWLNGAVSKTVVRFAYRGFESLSLRHEYPDDNTIRDTCHNRCFGDLSPSARVNNSLHR